METQIKSMQKKNKLLTNETRELKLIMKKVQPNTIR